MTKPFNYRAAEELYADLRAVKRAPLAERKAASAEFLTAMRDDPDLVAERITWILNGDYGLGAQQAAEQELTRSRANKVANLNYLVGALEWQCPADRTIQAWKTLSPAQKQALDVAIRAVVRQHDPKLRAVAHAAVATTHGRCKRSPHCVAHEMDPRVPDCKARGKGRRTP